MYVAVQNSAALYDPFPQKCEQIIQHNTCKFIIINVTI